MPSIAYLPECIALKLEWENYFLGDNDKKVEYQKMYSELYGLLPSPIEVKH